MNKLIEEQKKRIRYMYTWMFRRYRTNTLADSGSISDKPVLGPELIPDASRWFNIDNDPYWTKGTGWNVSGGVANCNTSGTYAQLYTNSIPISVGKTYLVSFEIKNYVSGLLRVDIHNALSGAYSANGFYTVKLTPTNNLSNRFLFLALESGSFVGSIDNVSVREVLINSVTTDYLKMAQNNRMDKSIRFGWLGEAGSKITSGRVEKAYSLYPNYQIARRNLLTYTEEFDNAAWSLIQGIVTVNSTVSPIGTLNADTFTGNGTDGVVRYLLPTNGINTYTASIYLKVTSGTLNTRIGIGNGAGSAIANKQITVDTNWNRYDITFTTSSIGVSLFFGGYLSIPNGISILAWGAQLEVGSVATDYQRVLEATNWDGSLKDATQTTAGSRPYITGNIAPNEKLGLKNPNGGGNFMTHPTISFAANESWSVTFLVKNFGRAGDFSSFIRSGGIGNGIMFKFTTDRIIITDDVGYGVRCYFTKSIAKFIGKNCYFSIVYNGTTCELFVNGVSNEIVNVTPFTFTIKPQYVGDFYGGINTALIIRSQALTQQQVTAEYTYLRSVYPEIESVDIGVETEKITNQADREFSSDTGFWTKGTGWTISGGAANSNAVGAASLYTGNIGITVNRRYKVTYEVKNYTSGQVDVRFGGSAIAGTVRNANGIYTEYKTADSAVNGAIVFYNNSNFVGSIDNISVVELPQTWATSNCEMAATTRGNVIQEMQANGNTEKITNVADREFTSITGNWTTGTGWSIDIANGRAIANNVNGTGLYGFSFNKYAKVTISIIVSSGSVDIRAGGNSTISYRITTSGTYTCFIDSGTTDPRFFIVGNSFNGSIDNVSVQEIGWSGSQELYDGIYAQTAEAASSVEKITNPDFTTNINGINLAARSTATWVAGTMEYSQTGAGEIGGGGANFFNPAVSSGFVVGRYYKVSYRAKSISGNTSSSWSIDGLGVITGTLTSEFTTFSRIFLCTSTGNSWWMLADTGVAQIDSISFKELGLSDATSIANYTYAAVKAAGFWCHYNNSVDNGAIYGKLYNWFAVKLLQMDIDKYNTDNPTTLWGWRVPTQTDFQTLIAYLGGYSVSGGKLKLVGTTYWNSPNTGADNSSGFSAIGGGFRAGSNGVYTSLNNNDVYWEIDKYRAFNSHNNASIVNGTELPTFGFSLRLIKS